MSREDRKMYIKLSEFNKVEELNLGIVNPYNFNIWDLFVKIVKEDIVVISKSKEYSVAVKLYKLGLANYNIDTNEISITDKGKEYFNKLMEGKYKNISFMSPIGKYDSVSPFNEEGLAVVKLNNKEGLINKEGVELTPLKYDSVSPFNEEELAVVELNNKYGFINKEGVEVIPLKYDGYIYSFNKEGLAVVRLNNKYGFINKEGVEVIPLMFDRVKYISENKYKGIINNDEIEFDLNNIEETNKRIKEVTGS
jgi:hypothetical protein